MSPHPRRAGHRFVCDTLGCASVLGLAANIYLLSDRTYRASDWIERSNADAILGEHVPKGRATFLFLMSGKCEVPERLFRFISKAIVSGENIFCTRYLSKVLNAFPLHIVTHIETRVKQADLAVLQT